jgi:hypothetical protein
MELGVDIHGLASETSVAAGLNQIGPHVKKIGELRFIGLGRNLCQPLTFSSKAPYLSKSALSFPKGIGPSLNYWG